ncbi:hypothetical protein HOP50_17g80350 [Chloropicon primus]|nr:hypothetical protein A3770_17p80110 [Chloropicon primus]UPR04690.1 hypothetical protein HOP50_17g80350 [Chloropicon primus]|eukprot:QDZ25493.1 hypothetical protein A3770_17p80110 [Chloropicon primus]
MDKAPLPLPRLVLTVEFNLTEVEEEWQGKDHQKACEEAARVTSLRPVDRVRARSVRVKGTATTEVAQAHTFQTDDDGVDVRLEYLYGSDGESMCMRVIANLERVDGVTSLRLGLHTLEVLEGGPSAVSGSAGGFKKNPPFAYGLRHTLNFARMIATTLADFALARLGVVSTLGANGSDEIPNSPASLIAYHSKASEPPPETAFRLFGAKEGVAKPYRQFLSLLELWGQRLGSWGYFVLNNCSPYEVGKVVPSEIRNVHDMHSMDKRYAGAFDRPCLPPGEDVWPLNNFYHVRRIFVNNYGRHDVATKARATAFKWDWVGLSPGVWGAGCAQFNGRFFMWMRGTDAGLDLVKEEAERSFAPLPSVRQIPKSALLV